VLAVAYTLLDAWVEEAKITPQEAGVPGGPPL